MSIVQDASNKTTSKKGDVITEEYLALHRKKEIELNDITKLLWQKIHNEMKEIDARTENFCDQLIPIKQSTEQLENEVKHRDVDFNKAKIDIGASTLLSKAGELFVLELTLRAFCCATEENELRREDIVQAILRTETYDLLADHISPGNK